MRKLAFITSIFILMTMSTSTFAEQTDELTDLTSVVTANNLSVDNWEVTIKEEMSDDNIGWILKKLQQKNSFKVSRAENENAVNYFFKHEKKDSSISEAYHVVIPKNAAYKAELVVVLQAENWNESIADDYINRKTDIKSTYFTQKSTMFACLTTAIGARMDIGYFFDKVQEMLRLTNIQTQTDDVKNSTVKKIVYGYTPMWEQKIATKEPMNLQMVVQNSTQESARLTIGTPILISEY